MAATIDSLPLELLGEILGYLHQPHQAALVCRRWREPAQRALFASVTLNSERRTRQWLDSPARPRYRTMSMQLLWISEIPSPELVSACLDLDSLNLKSTLYGGEGDWCDGTLLPKDLRRLTIVYPEDFTGTDPLACVKLNYLSVFVDGGDYEDLPLATLRSIFLPSHDTLTSICLTYLGNGVIAERLLEVFAATAFPNVRHLALWQSMMSQDTWKQVIASFPSLDTLALAQDGSGRPATKELVATVGTSVALTLRALIFTSNRMAEETLEELVITIRLPNLSGLCRLEIPMVSKDALAGEAGLALLDECEERSISLLCRYGYLTRSMMGEEPEPTRPMEELL